jgi:hypothetical protein
LRSQGPPSSNVYAKVAFAKLYDRKNALVAADLLNDRVLPFFEEHEIPLLRALTDRGTEYRGQREHHEYELYLAVENIDHSRTKARHPQTNGIRVYSSCARKVINSARSTSIVLTCARTSASMAVRSPIISTLSLVPSLPVVVSAAIVVGSGFSFR